MVLLQDLDQVACFGYEIWTRVTSFGTLLLRRLEEKVDFEARNIGVDTLVQGTVVQGPLCPRDISPRRLLSKETLVQGDYCPRLKFET